MKTPISMRCTQEQWDSISQTWQPSVKLRYLQQENQLVLQQLHISNLGNKMWVNVEIV